MGDREAAGDALSAPLGHPGTPGWLARRFARFWPLPPRQLEALVSSPLWAALVAAAGAPGGLSPPLMAVLAEMEQSIRDLFATRLLPLTDTARRALDAALPAFERLGRVADLSRLAETVEDARRALAAAAEAALEVYRGELAPLLMQRSAMRADGPRAGMDPLVAAIEAIAPESAAVAGFLEVRRAFEVLVDAAEAHLAPGGARAAERLAGVVKCTELARYYGSVLRNPLPLIPLTPAFVPLHAAGNLLDQLNAVYYALRGTGIYTDFVTAASLDSLLARADAVTFRAWLSRTRHGSDDAPIRVLEVGVGDGSFAAGFLDELALQDAAAERESPTGAGPLYSRLRYTLGDLSEAMLRDALANPALARHKERLTVAPSGGRLASSTQAFELQRYHELLDDLPGCALLYIDPAGRLHAAEVQGMWPGSDPPRRRDGAVVEVAQLGNWIVAGNLDALHGLQGDVLSRITWEVRFRSLAAEALPYGDLLPELLGPARDVLVPFAIGAARFLETCLERAAPGGMVRVFDYGFSAVGRVPTSYFSAAQVVRRYGASSTRNVFFGLLEAVARRRGARVRLLRQEQLIGEAGVRAMAYRQFAGLMGPARASRTCSGPEAPLPLQRLRSWEAVRGLAQSMGDDGRRYREFVSRLEAERLVTLGLSPVSAPHVDGLLARLAADLDFSVAAAFAPAALLALRRQYAWLDDPQALAGVARRLEAVGFAASDAVGALDLPSPGQLWMLEVVAPRRSSGARDEDHRRRTARNGRRPARNGGILLASRGPGCTSATTCRRRRPLGARRKLQPGARRGPAPRRCVLHDARDGLGPRAGRPLRPTTVPDIRAVLRTAERRRGRELVRGE